MGLFGKKNTEKQKEKPKEMKEYIRGAGGTIVSKSILNGTSREMEYTAATGGWMKREKRSAWWCLL